MSVLSRVVRTICVQVLQRDDPLSKETYQMSNTWLEKLEVPQLARTYKHLKKKLVSLLHYKVK